jgi:O-antigen ligase
MSGDESRSRVMSRLLRNTCGGLIVGALLFAPLAFAGTRPWAFGALISITASAGILWSLAVLKALATTSFPLPVVVGASLVAAIALAWCFLPSPEVPAFTVHHFQRVSARWPQSILPRDPSWLISWAAAAVLCLLACIDLCRQPVWRTCFVTAIVASGISVAGIGLVQNFTHAPGIYWQAGNPVPTFFFGTFYHHTSAGAFLNSVWPVGFALAAELFQRRQRYAGAIVTAGAMLVFAAHAGHISRFPQVVAVLTLLAALAWTRPWRFLARRRPSVVSAILVGAGLVVAIGIGVRGNRADAIRTRWSGIGWSSLRGGSEPAKAPPPPESWPRLMRADLFVASSHAEYPLGDRGAAYATAYRAIAVRPWLGWGPGGWMAAAAATSLDPFIRTFFQMLQFTHEDYLQTVVEWGLIGAAGWMLLVPASLWRTIRELGFRPERDLLAAGAALSLAAVLVQSLIDFPMQIPAVQLNAITLAALGWSAKSGVPAA